MPIVQIVVNQIVAPAPNTLQQTGALISQEVPHLRPTTPRC
jgi:hypothetical protein